jgi:hypothetical protein
MSIYHQLRFGERIETAYRRLLLTISEQQSLERYREGGWSRKEILGHLIDSALNNHQRFVRAALDGSYEGPTYDQSGWVNIHGYAATPWAILLEHWRWQNVLLGAAIQNIPDARLEVPCRVGTNKQVTLRFLVEDYMVHLQHHLDQMLSGS